MIKRRNSDGTDPFRQCDPRTVFQITECFVTYLRHCFAADLCRHGDLRIFSLVSADHSFFSDDPGVQRAVFCSVLLIINAVIQFEIHVLRSVDIAVYVLYRHLTDKILVKPGCRLHFDPEPVIEAQRIHLISCGFPLEEGLHAAVCVSLRIIGNASRVDEGFIICDVN